jgi:hypothetical protein
LWMYRSKRWKLDIFAKLRQCTIFRHLLVLS